jgi:hypothetical protein
MNLTLFASNCVHLTVLLNPPMKKEMVSQGKKKEEFNLHYLRDYYSMDIFQAIEIKKINIKA